MCILDGQYGEIPWQYSQIPGQPGSYYHQYPRYDSDSYSFLPMFAYGNSRPVEYNYDPSYFLYWNDGQKQTSANVFTILLSSFLTLLISLTPI
jgi:hypothetical protein